MELIGAPCIEEKRKSITFEHLEFSLFPVGKWIKRMFICKKGRTATVAFVAF